MCFYHQDNNESVQPVKATSLVFITDTDYPPIYRSRSHRLKIRRILETPIT